MKYPLIYFKDLRKFIYISFLIFTALFILFWRDTDSIIIFLLSPLNNQKITYHFFKLTTPLYLKIKISFSLSVLLSAPFNIMLFLIYLRKHWSKREKFLYSICCILVYPLTLLGIFFAHYFLIPTIIYFLKTQLFEKSTFLIDIHQYITFVNSLYISSAIIIQLPLIIVIGSFHKILTSQFLSHWRKYVYVCNFIIGAILTPPDVLSQIFLGTTLCAIYEISFLILKFFEYRGFHKESL